MSRNWKSIHSSSRSVIALTAMAWSGLFGQSDMQPGVAFVTSCQGPVSVSSANSRQDLDLHDLLEINNSSLRSGDKAHAFLKLSNGLSIGISSNSEVKFNRYLQAPFPPTKESTEYEPSTSELDIELHSGTLAIASHHLSPLSQMRIRTRMGSLRIRSANCLLKQDEMGLHIAIYQGSATFHYPDGAGREFIAATEHVWVNTANGRLNRLSDDINETQTSRQMEAFAKAAELARSRVIFRAPEKTGSRAQAILVAPPSYQSLPIKRPYQLQD